MKRTHPLLLISLFANLLLWDRAFAEPLISIGVSAPLTGESAVFGEDIKNVLLFAQDYFGDSNFKLDVQDDQCSGKGGVSASQYFVQQQVRAVLGFACVESIMPAIPPLRRAGIPVISVLASGPEITGVGRNVFNLYPSDDLGVKLIAKRLYERKISNALVLTAESAFPVGITEAFKRQLNNPALHVNYKSYPAMTSDFTFLLAQVGSQKAAQAIFINYSSAGEFISFLKERQRLKLTNLVLTSYLNGYDSIKAQGDLGLIEGVEFYDTAPIEVSLREKGKTIFENYLRRNGHLKSSDGYFPFIFNGYVALRAALSHANDTTQGLQTLRFENGIGDPFSFRPDGTVQGGVPFVLRKIENGSPVTIKEG